MIDSIENAYIEILKEELIPALGCTEPIAIAYAAAKTRETLGCEPSSMVVRCSGNIIKNAKAVYVPNTGGLKGIAASAIAGMIAGDSSLEMRVLEYLTDADRELVTKLLSSEFCRVEKLETDAGLHLTVELSTASGETALVEIIHTHTNISRIEKNGERLFFRDFAGVDYTSALTDRSVLNVGDIYDFARTVELESIEGLLALQVANNRAIAEEGLRNRHGLNVGNALLEVYGDSLWSRVRAYAAAGSDARMNGCSMPVVVNSGSGNQGMTTSLPVIMYAEAKAVDLETLYRALVLSNLITIHLKTGIGRLSAYCGAMSASAGAGCGITFLAGGTLRQIEDSITNTLADVSGIVCDGAKASCAAKIATGLDAAIIAHHMAMNGRVYESDSGIVKKSIEETVAAVGRLGRIGMRETDNEVLRIMLAP
ncbi:MAG: L-serine ammonia-lyase, iron-sulfur-dependent, subunit alpha [Treponemataceae bacterium]